MLDCKGLNHTYVLLVFVSIGSVKAATSCAAQTCYSASSSFVRAGVRMRFTAHNWASRTNLEVGQELCLLPQREASEEASVASIKWQDAGISP